MYILTKIYLIYLMTQNLHLYEKDDGVYMMSCDLLIQEYRTSFQRTIFSYVDQIQIFYLIRYQEESMLLHHTN